MENDINKLYFNSLLEKSKNKEIKVLILSEPEKGVDSNVVPLAIANEEDLQSVQIQAYEDLVDEDCDKLKDYNLCLLKMQAGLGTSVKRDDLIKEIENREHLGAKGTDLYFDIEGKKLSIAEIQLKQAYAFAQNSPLKKIIYTNLVNEETAKAVDKIWDNSFLDDTYKSIFNKDPKLDIGETISQEKMPTLNEQDELTTERLAPAGHGFIGFKEILDIFNATEVQNEIVAIGNGEDLSSSPDLKILNWMVEKNVPVVMITTTKTTADKKGGQISIVKDDSGPDFITIVEKAQAQASGQLEYFEQLGLRKSDRESLFNTNIVLINKKALKDFFDENLEEFSQEQFIQSIAPDVIRNVKEQDGKNFTQLESALGSVMLNLDHFFRSNFNRAAVSFLNLSPEDREKFFMPIKKREDYEEIKKDYHVDLKNFRLVKNT